MRIVSFDYSITSPCVAIIEDDKIKFEDVEIHYLTSSSKVVGKFKNIHGHFHKLYKTEMQRYENIASTLLRKVKIKKDDIVYIEGYSFGSKGRVFAIAENCGMLKYFLYRYGIQYEIVAPTEIKKWFSGKGNADKSMMHDAFVEKTGLNLHKMLTPFWKDVKSPVTDIVDAYALGLYAHDRRTLQNQHNDKKDNIT